MDEKKALKFLEHFSVITIGENKTPNFPWKEQQETKLSSEQFLRQYLTPTTKGIGIVTGFEDLEVIDVDTKVFSTQHEKDEFFNEYYQTLKDNVIDFEDKIAVYQTKSGGYHLLYKSKRVQGNTKIASFKWHKEACIETRGNGGYVFLYPEKKYAKKSYFDVDYISDLDREIIWAVSKAYNHIEEQPIAPKKEPKVYQEGEITPWDDFNEKTDIWEIIQDEFSIPPRGNKNKYYIIKRHNSTSPHSGYVFKDSGCMYLFSTATIYPNEKLISPFYAYAIKYHSGDFKTATKDLYEQGFGSRLKKKIDEIKPNIPEKIDLPIAEFPIDIFPKEIQFYISECHSKLDSNIDYMGVSLMWLISVCIGNSFEVEVKSGWIEKAVLWIAVVGKAGIGKTPSINNIIFPLTKINFKEIKRYYTELESYEHYSNLSKKEKEDYPEVQKPKKTQFIADDITLEALVDLHQESDVSVGVFKDELAGWLKDMNKYRAGSDLEFWLSCWSGKSVALNRMTRKGSFVDKPFIPVLGGIQPAIFNGFSTDENKDNGFLDRMLLAYPEATVDEFNENEMDYQAIQWYSETMTRFYFTMKSMVRRDNEQDIEPIRVKFSPEAKVEWIRIFNEITTHQNNDDENEYLKSMYPKQKSYIPRFALLINIFHGFFDEKINAYFITKESILNAEKLSRYFILNAKKVKIESVEVLDLKKASKKGETNAEKLYEIYRANPNFNRSKVAELLGVSRKTVYLWLKDIENVKS